MRLSEINRDYIGTIATRDNQRLLGMQLASYVYVARETTSDYQRLLQTMREMSVDYERSQVTIKEYEGLKETTNTYERLLEASKD